MENLVLDTGVKEYKINGTSVLRFNPSDPNVYNRFLDAEEQIRDVEREMATKAKAVPVGAENAGETAIRIMHEADTKIKDILNGVFEYGNDFHAILGGVNLLAVGNNGYRIISNLLDVLTSIMEQGAKDFADGQIAEAKLNRAQRRAMQ